MTTQHERFATLTCQIEDLHAVAVEGQSTDLTPDMEAALASCLKGSVSALIATLEAITASVERRS